MSGGFSRVQVRKLTDGAALYGVTNGTAAANKALVLDGSKGISTITSATITTITSTTHTNTGALTSGAFIDGTIEAGTTAANFVNKGVTTFGDTLGTSTFKIDNPVAGSQKFLVHNVGSSLSNVVTVGDSTVSINSSTLTKITFTAANQYATLRAISATQWVLASANSSLVTLSS